ncbi:MAG TPA: bifunctional [glutamine synthetase] adenylyltransferase/[glutamine synthetase]-adenylyl-L-tyrosine phosphorylase, partial [Devosiaceae bacterium]|nr:bifunctional [glutamine synthetase] adenylyltransferase/[glutamine synthetase]-adenylyl-L-tyrosine phosphorylase [Devosiaceae bacterium]
MPVSLDTLFDAAPHLADLAERHAEWFGTARGRPPDDILAEAVAEAARAGTGASGEAEIRADLRRAKARLALIAAVAEVTGTWTTERATMALSDFADAALDAGLEFLVREAAAAGRIGIDAGGRTAGQSGLAVLALGKLGGRELNFSSDIDLVAFYDADRAPLARPQEAARFYEKLVRGLTALIAERDENGYVFRTDLRLRPDPGSTPVAIPVGAALAYYEARGQNWERAAWIKARPSAGDLAGGEAFLKELAPFIWRKHLDFAAIVDIQAMKRQINAARKVGGERALGHNVKLGRGGIREIEFFAQTQQLIAGGREPALRDRSTVTALAELARHRFIEPAAAETLTEAYWFLRAVENRLQMQRDAQTHMMPATEAEMAPVAAMMGYDDEAGFRARYRATVETVIAKYAELFADEASLASEAGNLVFTGGENDPATVETLARIGFRDPDAATTTIRKWHYGSYAATRAGQARQHLTELVPALLGALAETGNADEALKRFDGFLAKLPAGVQLFALLRNSAQLLKLIVDFMASAPRMTEAVSQRVHIVDGLIDPEFYGYAPTRDELERRIDGFLGEARGFEDLIDRARIMGQEQMFLISAGLIAGIVRPVDAGPQFSTVAEMLLARVFDAVRREMARRHGNVPGAGVALLAFGKLASREMTATSDLDFVLLYDAPPGADASDGERPLDTPHYFARLTQRLVAALSAPTAGGVLYAADMRLRPSGNAGPLATSLAGFAAYQRQTAWTWEHLALTRARVVYADPGLGERIGTLIENVLSAPRDRDKTIADIIDMRQRLARERPPRNDFDLKRVD